MIKKIIHLADIHIPNSEDNRPFREMLKQAMAEIYKEVKKYDKDEVRIVIVGDIFDQKIRTSKEADAMFHFMLNYLNEMCKTIIVAGNHDMLQNNNDRLDAISPTFEIRNVYPNITFIDKTLEYKSGYVIDDNVVWCLYSMFDMFKKPADIEDLKGRMPDSKFIGLYHGEVVGAVSDIGRMFEGGIDTNDFKGCDCVMAGHIHKHQTIRKNGVPIVYSGSLFQKAIDENVTGHGFVMWDIPTMKMKHYEVTNNYRFFKLEVNDYEDIKNDEEILINY